MKIIFESEEEKSNFIVTLNRAWVCPEDLKFENHCEWCIDACNKCWHKALENMEVRKSESNVN